ncbi:hypothetical protein BC941DRAFT_420971 [Chlamydoabsidia padenii]|nr:hypothetical protein BC941DRAFT_420971 [Chlamydoabsidia padenii]
MVSNSILTAQFVQSVPVLFSKVLDCSLDDIIVQSIVASNPSLPNKRKRDSGTSGVILAMALPNTKVSDLQNLVANSSSTLYASDNGQLPLLIDKSYPISSQVSNPAGIMNDPNNPSSDNGNGGGSSNNGGSGLSRGGIIGICVSVGVVVYGAATVLAVRIYRRRKSKRNEQEQDHQEFVHAISAPIMHENTLGFTQHPHYNYGTQSSPPPPLQQVPPHTSTYQW